jgi:hypothetical protein
MSTKYIFYKPTKTPTVSELTKGIQANKKLSTDLSNARNNAKNPKPPNVKLSKIAEEFDRPYMLVREKLIKDLNEYELANAGNYDDPTVNAKIETMKRQIKDFAEFTTGEAEVYSFLVKASKNPLDKDGNPDYDVSSLKRMPKRLTQDDVTKAISNAGEGGDISYLFGGASPLKNSDGSYVFDEDGLLIDEEGNKIEGFNQDGSKMTTDEFVFENRRNFSNYLNPELFTFGERGIEFGGVNYEDVPELNFSKDEVMEAPASVDFIGNLTSSVKVQSGGYDMNSGKLNPDGEQSARNQIKNLITKKPNGVYPDNNASQALLEIAAQYLDEIQGVGDPAEEEIELILNSPDEVSVGGQSFNDYAENALFARWKEGKGYKPSKGMNTNIGEGDKPTDFFAGTTINPDVREAKNFTIVDEEGAAQSITTPIYAESLLNKRKTLSTFVMKQGVIFPQAIAGLEQIQDQSFKVETDNVRIQAIDISTGQIASKEQIEQGDPNVEFRPYVLAKATINTPMEGLAFLKKLNELPPEQQDSYSRLRDLLTKSDKTSNILIPLNQMFTTKEQLQFKLLQDEADRLNSEYKGATNQSQQGNNQQREENLKNDYPILQ